MTVEEALEKVELGVYAKQFEEEGIGLDLFPHLHESDLSFMKIGHRRKFLVTFQKKGKKRKESQE